MKDLLDNYHKLSDEKKSLLKILLKEKGIDINKKLILPQKREGNIFPLSFSQQRLWFLEQLEPNSSLYIIPSAVKISGPVKIDFLLKGLDIIVRRHEILRTRFIEKEGEGYQEILDEIKISPIEYDLSEEKIDAESKAADIIKNEFSKPFSLSECPLFHVVIIKITEDVNYLLLPMHHIISDNWSTGILIKELLECYKSQLIGKEPNLAELNIQYADYTLWQREWLASDENKIQKKYWYERLIESNKILEIIPDKKRPAVQTYKGSFELFEIDRILFGKLERLSKSEELTIFIIFLAAYQFVLAKYSRQNDINIGVPIANRNRSETEQLIGFFINTLVFRGRIDFTRTVREFLEETKKNSLKAYSNQDIPFEMVVESLNLERDMSHTALFQAMLVLNNAPVPTLKLEGINFEPLDIDTGNTKFDLVLSFTKNDNYYSGKFEFNTDLYNRSTIQSIIENLIFVLEEFTENIDENLSEVSLSSEDRIFEALELVKSEYKNKNNSYFLTEEFERIVEKFPRKNAVSDGKNSLTYRELNDNSNILARALVERGVKPGTPVGLFLDRRIEYITSIIGILKSGGTYIPLDIEYPKSRIEFMLKDSNIEYIINSESFTGLLDGFELNSLIVEKIDFEQQIQNNISVGLIPQNAAYVIYTSGSTGLPKGVIVEHSKITSHINNVIDEFGILPEDKYLAFATFNFDASIEQIFVPLLTGAEIFLRLNDYWLPADFIKLIISENITVINPPTVYWNQFVSEIAENNLYDLGKLRLVISGGSEMRTDLLNAWNKIAGGNIELINAYGPTETIITSSIYKAHEKTLDRNCLHIPIGRSIGNRDVFVLDDRGNILPPNVPGELCFSSDLLARGYQNNPSLTAERFVPDKYSAVNSGRMYLTGDMVRYGLDGYIEYLGRIDNQVKVRGYRIELSEIEKVLLEHKKVKEAAVVVNSVNEEDESIIAYVIIQDDVNTDPDLISFCKTKLPNYMIPNHIVRIEKFPLTPNGKIDFRKLPVSQILDSAVASEYIAPRSELEAEIAAILSETLVKEKIGVKDNFFDLGGHSILAIKVVSKLRKSFGVELELKNLFENPTVEGLSSAIIMEQSKLIDDKELDSLLEQIENME